MPDASPVFVDCRCPFCDGERVEPHMTAGDSAFDFPGIFHVARCRDCAMLYTRPRVAPNEIGRFYPPSYEAHAPDTSNPARSTRSRRDPWDRLPAIGAKRLLDVGCGSGGYLLRQKSAGWTVFGVEPSADAVRAARGAGLDVVQGVVPGVDFAERRFDCITMLGVIACVPEPLATLRELRRVIAPGGRLIVSEHNAGSAAAALFGPDWQGWDLPRHYSHFTPESLRRMMEHAGFRAVELRGRRRTSRWRHSARRKAAAGGMRWRALAGSRNLCSLASLLFGRGDRSDEIIVVATAS